MEASREVIDNTLAIFRTIGKASSLFVKEVEIKAMLISDRPLPAELASLDCIWEEEASLTKILGFYVESDLSLDRMLQFLSNELDRRLHNARKSHHLLLRRVVIANQLITSGLAYMLALWLGRWDVLEEFDRRIRDFFWSGKDTDKKPMVDFHSLQQPKQRVGWHYLS